MKHHQKRKYFVQKTYVEHLAGLLSYNALQHVVAANWGTNTVQSNITLNYAKFYIFKLIIYSLISMDYGWSGLTTSRDATSYQYQ